MERKITLKVCSVTDIATIDTALSASVSYIGCVFDPKSASCVTPMFARSITCNLPKSVNKVAVVSSPSEIQLNDIMHKYRPDYIQFNARESPQYLAFMKTKFQCKIIKNIFLEPKKEIEQIQQYTDIADLILLTPLYEYDEEGAIDWYKIRHFIVERNCIVSGKISKHNVGRILQLTSTNFLDICASPESNNGENDPIMLHEIISAIKTPLM